MKASWTFPSAIVSALLIVPAMAADLPTKAPILKAPPPLVYNWTGCYLGGGGGYGMLDQEHDTRTLTGVLTDPTMDTGGRGWFGTCLLYTSPSPRD